MKKENNDFRELIYEGHDIAPLTNEKGETRLVLATKLLMAVLPEEYKALLEQGYVDILQPIRIVLRGIEKDGE